MQSKGKRKDRNEDFPEDGDEDSKANGDEADGKSGRSGQQKAGADGSADEELDFEALAQPKFKKQRVAGPVPKFGDESASSSNSNSSSSSSNDKKSHLPFADLVPSNKLAMITSAAVQTLTADTEPMLLDSAISSLQSSTEETKQASMNNGDEEDKTAMLVDSIADNSANYSNNNSNSTSSSSNSIKPQHLPAVSRPTKPTFNLADYKTAADVEKLGADVLKKELERLGLKCGGTPKERAERLFLLKSTPLDKLPKKMFAK
jgi:hypothetical protein